jgi:hypothetical protein
MDQGVLGIKGSELPVLWPVLSVFVTNQYLPSVALSPGAYRKMRAFHCMALAVTALLPPLGTAKEVRPNTLTSQLYDSGAVHENLMALKMVCSPSPLRIRRCPQWLLPEDN